MNQYTQATGKEQIKAMSKEEGARRSKEQEQGGREKHVQGAGARREEHWKERSTIRRNEQIEIDNAQRARSEEFMRGKESEQGGMSTQSY